jgi:Aminopeptidase P, N-terminal domain
VLFVRERNATREMWDGPRTGFEDAQAFFGADSSLPSSSLDKSITAHLESGAYDTLFVDTRSEDCLAKLNSHSPAVGWCVRLRRFRPLLRLVVVIVVVVFIFSLFSCSLLLYFVPVCDCESVRCVCWCFWPYVVGVCSV